MKPKTMYKKNKKAYLALKTLANAKKQKPDTTAVSKAISTVAQKVVNKNVELKWYDLSDTSGSVVNTPVQQSLVLIPQGSGNSQRVGKRIIIKKIEIKGVVSSTFLGVARWVIDVVHDRGCRGANPQQNELYITDATSEHSARNPIFLQRLKMLIHKQISLLPYQQGESTKFYHVVKNVNIPIDYIGAAVTTADLEKSNIYFFMHCNKATADGISQVINCRLWYTDA